MSSGIYDKEENSPLYSATKEAGIFIKPVRKKVPGEQVMFPVQVRDTTAEEDLKNVDCNPKVRMEAVSLLMLHGWVCPHRGVNAKGSGKQQPIIFLGKSTTDNDVRAIKHNELLRSHKAPG